MEFQLPKIYAIVNYNKNSGDSSKNLLEKYLSAGITLIQLRAKDISKDEIKTLTLSALKTRDSINKSAKIIINDFLDICKSTNADGVHLGQGDGDPVEARELLGDSAIIGISTHSLEQINATKKISNSLSYLALGPIFESTTKKGHAAVVGTKTLEKACIASPLPLVAIGGINKENAKKVFSAGASSIALIAELKKAAEKTSGLEKCIEELRS